MTHARQKVFGVGLPKTATTSLEEGFVRLGYNKLGYSLEDLQSFLKSGFNQDVIKTTEAYDAFADWPWSLMYADLFETYGRNARYILTRRKSAEVWVNSMKRHSITTVTADIRHSVYGIHLPHGYEPMLIELYNRHAREVTEFFEAKGASDCLLDLEIGTEGDWERFCTFLGHEPIGDGFPHANPSTGREPLARVVFPNLQHVNHRQRGLERPELTLDEALLLNAPPSRRLSHVGQALRSYSDTAVRVTDIQQRFERRQNRANRYPVPLRLALAPSRSRYENKLTEVIDPYVADVFQRIAERRVFLSEAHDINDAKKQQLIDLLSRIVLDGRLLPNLLFPRLLSDFLLLESVFREGAVGTANALPSGWQAYRVRAGGSDVTIAVAPDETEFQLLEEASPTVSRLGYNLDLRLGQCWPRESRFHHDLDACAENVPQR